MTHLALTDRRAAQALDMPVTQFRAVVDQGALPPPVRIGGQERLRVDDLRAILSGDKAKPTEDFAF